MTSSYSDAFSDSQLIDLMARDNEALATENRRLNQIVDAFCVIAGASPSELPTFKEALSDALESAFKSVRFTVPEKRD